MQRKSSEPSCLQRVQVIYSSKIKIRVNRRKVRVNKWKVRVNKWKDIVFQDMN